MWSTGFEAEAGHTGYYASSSSSYSHSHESSSFEPSYPSSHAYGTSYSSMRRRRQGPVSRLGAALGDRVQDEWRKQRPGLSSFLQRYKMVLCVNIGVFLLLLVLWAGSGGKGPQVVGRHNYSNYYSRGSGYARAPSHYLSSKGKGKGGKLRRTGSGAEPEGVVMGTKGRHPNPPRFNPDTLPAGGAGEKKDVKEKGESKGRARRKDFFDNISGKATTATTTTSKAEATAPAASSDAAAAKTEPEPKPVVEEVKMPEPESVSTAVTAEGEGQCSKPHAGTEAVAPVATAPKEEQQPMDPVVQEEEDAFPFPTAAGGWPQPKPHMPVPVLEEEEEAVVAPATPIPIPIPAEKEATEAPTYVTTRAGDSIAVISPPCGEGACPASSSSMAAVEAAKPEPVAVVTQGPTYVPPASAAPAEEAEAAPATEAAAPAMCASAEATEEEAVAAAEPATVAVAPQSKAEEEPAAAEAAPVATAEPTEPEVAPVTVPPGGKCGKGLDSYVAAMLGR